MQFRNTTEKLSFMFFLSFLVGLFTLVLCMFTAAPLMFAIPIGVWVMGSLLTSFFLLERAWA